MSGVSYSDIVALRSALNIIGYSATPTLPPGTIIMYAGTNINPLFILCDGRSLDKSIYNSLYTAIGNTYGSTDTTFNVPDLRSRFIVGAGSGTGLSTYALGQTVGAESVTLDATTIPNHTHGIVLTDPGHVHGILISETPHTHALTDNGHTHTSGMYGQFGSTGLDNGNNWPSKGTVTQTSSPPTADAYTVNSASTGITASSIQTQTSISATIGDIGGSQPHENRPPALALTYMIFVG